MKEEMKNKAVFLDRDGTINLDKGYVYKIDDFELIPGVINALNILQELGYLIIIITNQSGIARGYFTEKDFKLLNSWMIDFFSKKGIIITETFYCPHFPNGKINKYNRECDCRKPNLGLFERAIDKYGIDISKSISIGDKIRDCNISLKYKDCKSYLVGNNENVEIIKEVINRKYENIFYRDDLYQVAKFLKQKSEIRDDSTYSFEL